MLRRPRPALRRTVLLALALILASAVACAGGGRAAAAPLEPTLNLQQLQALLDASVTGTVSGYFLTVDKGSHIARIPMTVNSIVDSAGPDGALILFQADMTDPVMATIGNIAGGMSGSPLYVPDGGSDKLIGALSYGDTFTLAGYGMATPIEYMSAIEARYPASATARDAQTAATSARTYTTTLQQPVAAGGGAVNRIVVTPSTAVAATTAHPAGTLVFAPMESAQISGLPYGSKAYQAMANALQKRGIAVQRGLGAGSGGLGAAFSAPLQAGSALASMYAVGDFFAGYIGTVTYVDGQSLMAFGHPIDWIGATSEYLCNFRIDAIWADSMEAYKVGTLGALRGTVMQDRGSGVAARLDRTPAQVPITAHASVTTDATRTADGTSYLTQFCADSGLQLGSSLAASAVSVPIYRASDATVLPGSATTVSTVKVTDGTTHYTVRIANLWDDPADVEYQATQDIFKVVGTLEANPDGIAPAIIESIDLQATVTSARQAATIADVTAPGGLHAGANVLHVQVYANGESSPRTIDVPLTIPADAATTGQIAVVPATYDDSSVDISSMRRSAGRAADPRLTLAQTVDQLNTSATNDMVEVQFDPITDEDGTAVITGTSHSSWVMAGRITKRATAMTVTAKPARVKKNGRVTLRGRIESLSTPAVVHIYRRYLGSKKSTRVGTATALPGSGSFSWRSGKLSKGAVFTATWDGSNATDPTATSTTLGASASVLVPLRHH
jgi:hypothetical protein